MKTIKVTLSFDVPMDEIKSTSGYDEDGDMVENIECYLNEDDTFHLHYDTIYDFNIDYEIVE